MATPSARASTPAATEEALDRWYPRLFIAFVYVVLVAVTAVILETEAATLDAGQTASVLGLVAFVALVRGLWQLSAYERGANSLANVAFFVVHGAAVTALCLADPLFGFYAWIGFVDAMVVLSRWWALAGVTWTAIVVAASQQAGGTGLSPTSVPAFVLLVVLSVTIAWCIGRLTAHMERQSEQRRAMIIQLEHDMREIEDLQSQLVAQAREAGRLEERARVARDLHDTVAQGLVGIVTQLEAAERDEDWRTRVRSARALGRDSLAEARRAIAALASPTLDGTDLPGAVEQIARQWSAVTGIPTTVTVTGAVPTAPSGGDLLRICQESLANVARHSDADRAAITLCYLDDVLRLDVGDDGHGFDPAATPPGYGIVGMRNRVEALGGTLEIETSPGEGCVVSASVPVRNAAAAPLVFVAEGYGR